MPIANKQSKDVPLEALRGIAALVVVMWHCCVGFWPQHTGMFPEFAWGNWQGSPFFIFMNGRTAVTFFFVLSGFVLTRRYFLEGNSAILLKGAIKRWPRLTGPVFVTVLASYCLFKLGFYHFEQAGILSGSPWLQKFAHAYEEPFPIHFWDAFKQGLFFTFFRGDATYDTSLWTMHPEFIGSFIVFGMAPILLEARKISNLVVIIVAACVMLIVQYTAPDIAPFPVGVTIAALLPQKKILTRGLAWILLTLAIYLLGFTGNYGGAYKILRPFGSTELFTYPSIIGATILICLVETYPPLHKKLSGKFWQWIGEFSFPIYLIHVLVICSLGSAIYIAHGKFPAMISVFIATPIAAIPLVLFNRKWVSAVNHMATYALSSRPENKWIVLRNRVINIIDRFRGQP